jgi:GMP synthase-like glutamine amidotransferase
MKPVAIFRHTSTEGPGYFATYLTACQIPWRVIRVDAGEPMPAEPRDFSGLVFMGGPMSVNDDLPWIPPALDLIRAGVASEVPILGHCLGSQLMSKALGGVVTRNRVKEIGWGEVAVCDSAVARNWFGERRVFMAFHWHGETFSLPPGATRILTNDNCENQAFTIGKHLGMQCHVEMTEKMIDVWCETGAREIAASDSPAVQSASTIKGAMSNHLSALTRVAEGVYTRWIEGLVR